MAFVYCPLELGVDADCPVHPSTMASTMIEKPRCQAFMLMPSSRSWRKRFNDEIRCRFQVKEGNFCGVHAKLGEVIDAIIWREDNGS